MKILRYFITLLLAFLIITNSVLASSCSFEQRAMINNQIGNIKTNYEIKERIDENAILPDELIGTDEAKNYVSKSDYMQINILNLTEYVYAEVTNDYDNQTMVYQYSDTNNGTIEIEWRHINDLAKFTIVIKASNKTDCEGETLRTLTLLLPRYNEYSIYDICSTIPDYYMCQRYVFYSDDIEFSTLLEKVNKEIEKEEQTSENEENNKVWYIFVRDFVVEHKKVFIAAGGVIILTLLIGTVIIVRKRRNDIL